MGDQSPVPIFYPYPIVLIGAAVETMYSPDRLGRVCVCVCVLGLVVCLRTGIFLYLV